MSTGKWDFEKKMGWEMGLDPPPPPPFFRTLYSIYKLNNLTSTNIAATHALPGPA